MIKRSATQKGRSEEEKMKATMKAIRSFESLALSAIDRGVGASFEWGGVRLTIKLDSTLSTLNAEYFAETQKAQQKELAYEN